jgi:hypothetical protein
MKYQNLKKPHLPILCIYSTRAPKVFLSVEQTQRERQRTNILLAASRCAMQTQGHQWEHYERLQNEKEMSQPKTMVSVFPARSYSACLGNSSSFTPWSTQGHQIRLKHATY